MITRKTNKLMTVAVALLLAAASCIYEDESVVALRLSTSAITAVVGDSSYTVIVTSNSAWTAKSSTTWCTVSPASGEGNDTITVTVAANTITTIRRATITVQAIGAETKTVAVTQDAKQSVPFTWTLEGGTLTVSGTCPIPDYEEEGVGSPWYAQRDSITSVIISEDITSIGDWAFSGCSGLTTLTLSASVTSIGIGAFARCSGLTSIIISNSVTSIGNVAFYDCTNLTALTLPASVTSIGENVFRGCFGIKAFHVDSDNPSYSSDGGVLFNKDKSILIQYPTGGTGEDNYTIPNSVTSIGDEAFEGHGLVTVTIPTSVVRIGYFAFARSYDLAAVHVSWNSPDDVALDENRSFAWLGSDAKLYVPEVKLEAYKTNMQWLANFSSTYIVG